MTANMNPHSRTPSAGDSGGDHHRSRLHLGSCIDSDDEDYAIGGIGTGTGQRKIIESSSSDTGAYFRTRVPDAAAAAISPPATVAAGTNDEIHLRIVDEAKEEEELPSLTAAEERAVLAQYANGNCDRGPTTTAPMTGSGSHGSSGSNDESAARQLLDEYLKFMHLVIVGASVERRRGSEEGRRRDGVSSSFRPPETIDAMWHSHIVCTREYFAFCERYNGGKYIHRHRQNDGNDGNDDDDDASYSFSQCYEATVKCYTDVFGTRPKDENIWPLYNDECKADCDKLLFVKERSGESGGGQLITDSGDGTVLNSQSSTMNSLNAAASPFVPRLSIPSNESCINIVESGKQGFVECNPWAVQNELPGAYGNSNRSQALATNIEVGSQNLSLEDIIHAHEHYLCVMPSDYVAGLRDRLDVITVLDLMEVMRDCSDALASMALAIYGGYAVAAEDYDEDFLFCTSVLNGVKDGMEEEFCKAIVSKARAVISAGAEERSRGGDATMHSSSVSPTSVAMEDAAHAAPGKAATNIDDGHFPILPPVGDLDKGREAVARDGRRAERCPIRTCIDPKPYIGGAASCRSNYSSSEEKDIRETATVAAEKFEGLRKRMETHTNNSLAVQETRRDNCASPPLSAAARPFEPWAAPPLEPPRKAVVVEISAPKLPAAAKTRRAATAALPGMEYLVGVDGARAEVKRTAARLEKKKMVEKKNKLDEEAKKVAEREAKAKLEKEVAAMTPRHDMYAKIRKEQSNIVEKKPSVGEKFSSSCSPAPKPKKELTEENADEMPSMDEMMAFLGNKTLSKEERGKMLDDMFG